MYRTFAVSLLLLLGTSARAEAQTEVFASALFGFGGGEVCSEGGLTLDECNLSRIGWQVEPAYYVTEHLAVVGRAHGIYGSLDTHGTYREFGLVLGPFDVEATARQHGFYGGARVTGLRQGRRVVPYGQVLVGAERLSASVRVFGQSESDTETGFGLSPEGGVFVRLTDNTGIRLGVGADVIWIAGGTETSVRVATGFMFEF